MIAARRMEGQDGLALLLRARELPSAKGAAGAPGRVDLGRAGGPGHDPRSARLRPVRPWLPVEQYLYLPVSEFLAAWEKSRGAPRRSRSSAGAGRPALKLRDILARVGIPFGFYPDDSPDGRRLLDQAGEDGSRLPVVLFRRGLVLVDPSHAELTRLLGMRTSPAGGGAC